MAKAVCPQVRGAGYNAPLPLPRTVRMVAEVDISTKRRFLRFCRKLGLKPRDELATIIEDHLPRLWSQLQRRKT